MEGQIDSPTLQPPFDPSVGSLCHPWFTTNLSYRFPIVKLPPPPCAVLLVCYVMSCHVMSCRVVSCRVMSCHVMSCHVMSCLLWYVLLCYVLLGYLCMYVCMYVCMYTFVYVYTIQHYKTRDESVLGQFLGIDNRESYQGDITQLARAPEWQQRSKEYWKCYAGWVADGAIDMEWLIFY